MTELVTRKVDKVSAESTQSQSEDSETKKLAKSGVDSVARGQDHAPRPDKRKLTSAENLKKAREAQAERRAALKEMKARVPAKELSRKLGKGGVRAAVRAEPESESEESEEDEDDESESESEDEDDDYSDDDEPMERPVLQRQVGYSKPSGQVAHTSRYAYSSGRSVGKTGAVGRIPTSVRKEIVLTARGRPKKEPKLPKKEQARLDALEQMMYTMQLAQEKAQSAPKKTKAKKAKKVKSDRGSTTINVVTPGATVPTKSSASASMAQSAIAF
jgi:hypothetical protein